MQNKRIFITGGTGFFGRSLLRHCKELKGNKIVLLTPDLEKDKRNLFPLQTGLDIEFLSGDVRDFIFPDCEFDYILHAATTSCKIIPDDEMRSVVIDGTRHILDFARQNKNLSNFLYVSSGAVYGSSYKLPLHEDLVCQPETVYGTSKLEAENLCLNSGIPFSIARCFAFVGEYLPLDKHFAIGNFIRDCLKNLPIIIKGDGRPIRTYLYSGDLAHWLWTILIRGANGRKYNVGSDREISISELARLVRQISNSKNDIQILKPPSNSRPHRYVPNVSRAKYELGLLERTSLEEAIYMTMKYHGLEDKKPLEPVSATD